MGGILCAPIRSQLLSRAGSQNFRAGGAMMQGFREDMEDAHTMCLALKGHPDVAFFGVYDGHSGDRVSKFLARELHHRIARLGPDFEDDKLRQAVVDFDLEVGNSEFKHNGSTCVFVLVRPLRDERQPPADVAHGQSWRVTAVNVGDSRAMLVRANGGLVSLTEDHKPENRSEKARIERAGGFVQNDRTDGELAMSRAIGDYKYKMNPKLSAIQQKVIALPDIKHDVVHPGDRLLVVCDGVVERIDNRQVVNFVHSCHKDDPALICRELLLYSLACGSTDNHSAILVQFEDGSDYSAPDNFIPGPLKEWEDNAKFREAYIKNAEAWGQSRANIFRQAAEADKHMPKDWKRVSKPPSGQLSPWTLMMSVGLIAVVYHIVFNIEWGAKAVDLF